MGLREQAKAVIEAREAFKKAKLLRCTCTSMCVQRDGCQCERGQELASTRAKLDFAVMQLCDEPEEPTLIIDNPSIMLKVAGKRFRCSCGGNVFSRFTNGQYQCNSCDTLYEGE